MDSIREPVDIQKMTENCGLGILKYAICDESRGSGQEAITDLVDRIPKACPDVSKDNVKAFIRYMKKAMLDPTLNFSGMGATTVYKIVT